MTGMVPYAENTCRSEQRLTRPWSFLPVLFSSRSSGAMKALSISSGHPFLADVLESGDGAPAILSGRAYPDPDRSIGFFGGTLFIKSIH